MTPSEVVQAVKQRLVPKLECALKTTLLDKKQCKAYTTALRTPFVAPMDLDQNYPGTVLHTPVKYGGMEFPNVEYLQNQTQLEYWLKQVRWEKKQSATTSK